MSKIEELEKEIEYLKTQLKRAIKPKFRIGQEVYRVKRAATFEVVKTPKIVEINFDGKEITYVFEDDYFWTEKELFGHKDDAIRKRDSLNRQKCKID